MNDVSLKHEILVKEGSQGERLDVFLARHLVDKYSRTRIKKMIEEGSIRIDGREVTAHHHIRVGETIQVLPSEPEGPSNRAEDIPIEIVYEDEDVLVVNKPTGMVVHPAHGNLSHTLVNALLYHTQNLSGIGGNIRPGIVHRLDKDTSGLLVIAKNDRAHRSLAKQFKNHTIERMYLVAVKGVVQHNEGVCEEPIGRAFLNRKKVMVKPSGGKAALTLFQVDKRFAQHSLLKVFPQTGRTHQIRVHMQYIGHPVLGDALYGVSCPWIQRQALHAKRLAFMHPTSHKKMNFDCELPEDMKYLLKELELHG